VYSPLQPADAERLEHGRCNLGEALGISEVAVHGVSKLRVPQAQVFLGDAAAAGEQVERELRRVLVLVLADALEPLQRCLRCPLRGSDHGPALGLVGHQG
jgi:hypothetical protein